MYNMGEWRWSEQTLSMMNYVDGLVVVLNAWFLWPFQLFCFNVGSTHGIHHFVVGEPFYIRQLTAPAAHRVMRSQGIRFNDLGTFLRANRYALSPHSSLMKSHIKRPVG